VHVRCTHAGYLRKWPVPDVIVRDVGQCIYCDARHGLTTEHIVPRSLGGTHVLTTATCRSCQDATSRIERVVSRGDLLLFRTILGLPTYRPKNRPRTFRAKVRRGTTWSEEEVPLRYLAGAALFPRLPVPGAWDRREASAIVQTVGVVGLTAIPRTGPSPDELAYREDGIEEITVPVSLNPVAFMKLLAKVAWGFAAATPGIERVSPGVRGIILGTDSNVAGWVGSPPPGLQAFDKDPAASTFQIRVHVMGPGLVVANVRLFAAQGAPEYFVVVGAVRWQDRWCPYPRVATRSSGAPPLENTVAAPVARRSR
jgi:hypothetical protein